MSERWAREHFSVELPGGWSGETDGDTAILSAADGPGTLQIRSFLSAGRPIDDGDLRELAKFHEERGATLFRVRYAAFTGYYVHYESQGTLWWEWWLRRQKLALHATYHCAEEARSEEEAMVAAILGTLRAEGAAKGDPDAPTFG